MFTKWWRRQRQTIRSEWATVGPYQIHWEDVGGEKLIFQKWRLLLVCDLHGSGNGGKARKPKCRSKKEKKKSCQETVSSLDAISLELRVVIEQGGNAFSVCTGRRKELKGKCRILKQRCVGEEGDLYIKLVKTVAAGRALCRSGTYIKSRGASTRWADAVINHGAGFDSSVAQAVWKMDSIYCRGCLRGFARQPSISQLSPKEGAKRTRISFHHLPRQVVWFSVAQ